MSEKLLAGEANYVRDGLKSHVLISQAGMSTTGHDVSAKGMDYVLTSMFIRILENLLLFKLLLMLFANYLFWFLYLEHVGSLGGRIFAPYYVYKGKAAFSVDPVLPTFMKLDV